MRGSVVRIFSAACTDTSRLSGEPPFAAKMLSVHNVCPASVSASASVMSLAFVSVDGAPFGLMSRDG